MPFCCESCGTLVPNIPGACPECGASYAYSAPCAPEPAFVHQLTSLN